MEDRTTPGRKRISSTEIRGRLINTVIELAERLPLQELTVRRIAQTAQTDPKTIFRNFENLEDLFIAAIRELEHRVVKFLEASGPGDFQPISPGDTYVRFTIWLFLSGTDPIKLRASPEATHALRVLTLGEVDAESELSERTKAALFMLLMAFLAGQSSIAAFQTDVFTPEATLDAVDLITAMIQDLPRLTDSLGWNTGDSSS